MFPELWRNLYANPIDLSQFFVCVLQRIEPARALLINLTLHIHP